MYEMCVFFHLRRYLDASMKFVPQCSTALFNVFKAKCCRGSKRSKLKCLVGNQQEGSDIDEIHYYTVVLAAYRLTFFLSIRLLGTTLWRRRVMLLRLYI